MKKLLIKFSIIMFSLVLVGIIGGIGTIMYFSMDLPKISTLADYRPSIPSQILAKDGTVLAEIGLEKREITEINEIPKMIVSAFLSAEDSNFYEHTGVDYLGVMRAMMVNIKAGRVVQGGSTITQQVAKSLLLTRERSFTRKIKDFLLALKIEEKFTKEEILYLYLNQVYLGGGYYGVKAAFRGYFGKELSEATPAEAAMVAGLLVAPGRYSPYVNPDSAVTRQRYVLSQMHKNNIITADEYNEALKEKIKFFLRKPQGFNAPYFTDWVRQRVIELVGEERLLNDGFRVTTTLDWELQQVAERNVIAGVKELDKRQGYKGPLGNLKTSEEIEAFEKSFREKIYRDSSSYFTLSDDRKSVYELVFEPEQYQLQKDAQAEWLKNIKSNRFSPGYDETDRLLNYLKVGDNYEAVVMKTDDTARLVYVSLGGVPGIISYEHFRWAHERYVGEERKFFPYVTRPSTILKRGDRVLVRVLRKEATIIGNVNTAFVDQNKDSPQWQEARKQKFLFLELDQEPEAQGALVSMDPKTGEIISFVGGVDFSKSQYNRATQSKRQPGSSFKPFIFAAALENGYTPSSIILDSPEALGGVDDTLNWKPRNYDNKFKGPTTFRNSLEQSRNIPTIKLAESLGVPTILDFTNRIGFNAELDRDLSLALGSFGITLLDMVATYSIFPNGGKLVDGKSITSIVDREGNRYELDERVRLKRIASDESIEKDLDKKIDQEVKEIVSEVVAPETTSEALPNPFLQTLSGTQVYDPRLSYIMSNLLRGAVLYGTARAVRDLNAPVAGKTGTTNNYIDAWFVGFTSNIVTGVWTGFDDPKTLGYGETGSRSALPIWKGFMEAGIRKHGEMEFRVPMGIINVLVNKEKGTLTNSRDPQAFMEAFASGTEPGAQVAQPKTNGEQLLDNTILEEDDYYSQQ
jgi:penicillin-binding protein 1A